MTEFIAVVAGFLLGVGFTFAVAYNDACRAIKRSVILRKRMIEKLDSSPAAVIPGTKPQREDSASATSGRDMHLAPERALLHPRGPEKTTQKPSSSAEEARGA